MATKFKYSALESHIFLPVELLLEIVKAWHPPSEGLNSLLNTKGSCLAKLCLEAWNVCDYRHKIREGMLVIGHERHRIEEELEQGKYTVKRWFLTSLTRRTRIIWLNTLEYRDTFEYRFTLEYRNTLEYRKFRLNSQSNISVIDNMTSTIQIQVIVKLGGTNCTIAFSPDGINWDYVLNQFGTYLIPSKWIEPSGKETKIGDLYKVMERNILKPDLKSDMGMNAFFSKFFGNLILLLDEKIKIRFGIVTQPNLKIKMIFPQFLFDDNKDKYFNMILDAFKCVVKLAAGEVEVTPGRRPSAAVDNYFQPLTPGRVMVIHIGGFSTEVTLFVIPRTSVQLLASSVNLHFGGKNVDEMIAKSLTEMSQRADLEKIFTDDALKNKLLGKCEQMKIVMTEGSQENTSFIVNEMISDLEPELTVTLTRAEFEKICKTACQKVVDFCKEMLNGKSLKGTDIRRVIVIGGCSLIPDFINLLSSGLDIPVERVNHIIEPQRPFQ